ncbi:acyltransferase [Pseudomonas aeruginosa]|uniref:acyltransferase family protein n=1 Tax=Pseudomonas aeruginosa TaxID=287 RepID=UPI001559290C|nr:acyltransferase [Pseudomonas aeruginosa]NPX01786.1 acyltransferase [Pseudomonas aeruginosa]
MTFNPNSRYHSRLIRAFAEGKEMLYGIQYLRGIAALIVVLFHFRFVLDNVYAEKALGSNLFGGGAVGVDIFFMISGFIIVFATKSKRAANPLDFAARRIFRIYPLLILTMIVGGMTVYAKTDFLTLARATIPLNRDYSMGAPTFGFNIHGPAWTLTYELWFYAVFCAAMYVSHRWRTAICCAALALQIVVLQLAFDGALWITASRSVNYAIDQPFAYLARLASSTMFYEFIVGMVAAELFISRHQISKTAASAVLLSGIGIFIVFFTSQNSAGFGPQGFGTWSILLFLGVVAYQKSHEIGPNKTLYFLGEISYSMYLSHYLIVSMIPKYANPLWVATSGFSRFFMLVFVTIAVSTVIHYLLEKPAIRLGKNISDALAKPKPAMA